MNPLNDPKRIAKIKLAAARLDAKRLIEKNEHYYGVVLSKPRLEHVYKDRSWKAALSMDLKISGRDTVQKDWAYNPQHK